jgi:ribonucleoside-diphosphate reductase alpha chain
MSADNVSSGIEPVFDYEVDATIIGENGPEVKRLQDYGVAEFGVKGRVADELSPEEHVDVLIAAQKYVDSAVSKTCNVGDDVSWERFKGLYERAHDGGAKGCTTFRAAGKRYGVRNKVDDKAAALDSGDEKQAEACMYDPETGIKTCDE